MGGIVSIALFLCSISAAQLPRSQLLLATGPDDQTLVARIAQVGPGVNADEARRVAETAYNTGRQLAAEWDMASSGNMQSFLINIGSRKYGYCYHFANELLLRLDALRLRTLQLHWAESDPGTDTEHNVIVVTAKGQPFEQGILLDNWRRAGHLLWGPVTGDPTHYWLENRAQYYSRLQHPRHYSRIIPHPEPERSPTQKTKREESASK
jgi:hypothetical protein